MVCNSGEVTEEDKGSTMMPSVVGKKAHLGTKQYQAVKKSSPKPFALLSYAWLKASVS